LAFNPGTASAPTIGGPFLEKRKKEKGTAIAGSKGPNFGSMQQQSLLKTLRDYRHEYRTTPVRTGKKKKVTHLVVAHLLMICIPTNNPSLALRNMHRYYARRWQKY